MKEFSLLKIYLVIISIVGLIGAIIGYGNLGYQVIKYNLISNEEYVLGNYDNYLITQCDNPVAAPTKELPNAIITKTPEEIVKCKDIAKADMINRRAFDFKDNIISGGVWGTLFLILFITHFPVFYKKYKEDKK